MYTQLSVMNNQRLRDFDTVVLKIVHTFANVDWLNAWLVLGRQKPFATWEIQGSEVVSPCKILCSTHGYI